MNGSLRVAVIAAMASSFTSPVAFGAVSGTTVQSEIGANISVNWKDQLGPFQGSFIEIPTPQTVSAASGLQVQLDSAGGHAVRADQGVQWFGNLPFGEPLIWTEAGASDFTLTFSSPVDAVGAYFQPNHIGYEYNGVITAYAGADELLSFSASSVSGSNSAIYPPLFLGIVSTDRSITSIRYSLPPVGLDDSLGGNFAIGTLYIRDQAQPSQPPGSPVPEPSTWAILVLGFTIVGATARFRWAAI